MLSWVESVPSSVTKYVHQNSPWGSRRVGFSTRSDCPKESSKRLDDRVAHTDLPRPLGLDPGLRHVEDLGYRFGYIRLLPLPLIYRYLGVSRGFPALSHF